MSFSVGKTFLPLMTRSMNGSIDRRTVTQCTIQLLVILLCSDCWTNELRLGWEQGMGMGLGLGLGPGRCVGKCPAHNLRYGRLVAAFMVLWLTTPTMAALPCRAEVFIYAARFVVVSLLGSNLDSCMPQNKRQFQI